MKKDIYTATEVGTLLESMGKKIDFLTEIVVPLPEQLNKIEQRLGNVVADVRIIKDVIRIEIPSIKSRLAALETK